MPARPTRQTLSGVRIGSGQPRLWKVARKVLEAAGLNSSDLLVMCEQAFWRLLRELDFSRKAISVWTNVCTNSLSLVSYQLHHAGDDNQQRDAKHQGGHLTNQIDAMKLTSNSWRYADY